MSTTDDIVIINKTILVDIQTCLQHTQEKVELLELESKLQQEELEQWSHHSELVSSQNIEIESHKQKINIFAVD